MFNSNKYDGKEDYRRERDEKLANMDSLNRQAQDAFSDSFFNRESNIDNNINRDRELDNSYEEYKQEKYELQRRYDYYAEHVTESRKSVLIILLSVGALGIMGYLGYNYLKTDTKKGTQNIELVKDVNSSKVSQKIVDNSNKDDIKVEIPKEQVAVLGSTTTEASQDTSAITSREREIMKRVIKTLKKKKEKEKEKEKAKEQEEEITPPTPVKIVESPEKVINKEEDKPKHVKTVERRSRIVATNVRKEKAKREKSKKNKFEIVIVRRGDSLASISKKFYGNPMYFNRIIKANSRIRSRYTSLRPGQKIIVPLVEKKKKRRYVRVRRGDTLSSIAEKFYGDHTKIQKIINANHKIRHKNSRLNLGQKIYVPR